MSATTTKWTKDVIKENLRTNVQWMIRCLEVLYLRQTEEEKKDKMTKYNNGMGFSGVDAEILTSFHNQVQKRKQYHNSVLLSEKQISICSKKLPKYWKQVKEEIENKKQLERTE
jgi:hypothetical protein